MPDFDFDFDFDGGVDSGSGSDSELASMPDISGVPESKSRRNSALSLFEYLVLGANLWLAIILVLGGTGWVLSKMFPWDSYTSWCAAVVVLGVVGGYAPGFWRECNQGRIIGWLGILFLGAINLFIGGLIALALVPEEISRPVNERIRVMTGEQAPEDAASKK